MLVVASELLSIAILRSTCWRPQTVYTMQHGGASCCENGVRLHVYFAVVILAWIVSQCLLNTTCVAPAHGCYMSLVQSAHRAQLKMFDALM